MPPKQYVWQVQSSWSRRLIKAESIIEAIVLYGLMTEREFRDRQLNQLEYDTVVESATRLGEIDEVSPAND